jgi:hypothetical protein
MNRYITLTALALLCGASFSARASDDDTVQAAAATGAAECRAAPGLTRVERQVVDKAAQGVRPLMQFIQRTRMIYQLDAMETVAWLDRQREAQRTCALGVARLASHDE